MGPFDLIGDVSHEKKDLTRTVDDGLKSYNTFLTNRAFSYHPDTLLFSAEMNKFQDVDPQQSHDFYLHSLRPRKRFGKWSKKESDEDIELISRWFRININQAREYMKILGTDDLEEIRTKINI